MMHRRIIKAAFSNYAGKITSVAVWFLLTPVLLRHLGPGGYGLWVLLGSLATYGWLLDLGLGGGVVKFVAEHVARKEIAQARRVVATASWLYLALGAAAVVLSVAVAPLFVRVFDVAAAERSTAMMLVVLTGVTVGLTVALTPTTSVLQGLQRYDLLNVINISGSLITAAAVLVVLGSGGGLLGLVALNIPVLLLTRAAQAWTIRRVAPDFGRLWGGGDRATLKRLGSFSASLFAIHVAGRLNFKTDEFVIGAMRPVSLIAPYAVARKLSAVAELIADQFIKILMPLASELHARDDAARLREVYVAGTRLTLAVLLPITLALAVLAEGALTAWVGADYAHASDVVAILAVASLVNTSQWPASSVLQGMSRHRLLAFAALASGVVNLGLSIALIGPLGLQGVALGTLVPAVASSLFVVMPYAMRTLRVRARVALAEIWLPALLPALPAGLLLVVLERAFAPSEFVPLAAVALAGAVLYVAVYLGMDATSLERSILWRLTVEARGTALRHRPLRPGSFERPPPMQPERASEGHRR